jgi:predicted heme/steroid binding protein
MQELAKYNGKNGVKAYIAYKGKVYDVSDSFLWKDGNHEALHYAGMDLTEVIEQAPHGGYVLEKFPIIGTIVDEDKKVS